MADKRKITAEDIYNLKTVEDPAWSPDGSQLAFVRMDVDKASNGYRRAIWCWQRGWDKPRQFTTSGKLDYLPRFSPDGKKLAFISTRGGKPQVYLIPLDGGEAKALTSAPNGVGGFSWRPDGKAIAYTTSMNKDERRLEKQGKFPPPPPDSKLAGEVQKLEQEDDEKKRTDPRVYTGLPFKAGTSFVSDRYTQIYILDVGGDNAKPKRITDKDADHNLNAWSPDGRSVWASATRRPMQERYEGSDIIRIDVKSGKSTRLHRPGHESSSAKPSPDGKWVACISTPEKNGYSNMPRLTLVKPNGTGWRDLNLELDRGIGTGGNAMQFYWSENSQGLYMIIETEGDGEVHYLDIATGKFKPLVTGTLAYMLSPNSKGELAYVAYTPERFGDLYVTGKNGAKPQRITDFNDDFLKIVHVAKTQTVRYKAPDGTRIHGWMLKPIDFNPKKKYPLALNVHGGPHVMWSPAYPSMWIEWQLHAARGYVVFACNPRGSDGYGQAFRSAIWDNWGKADMHDILSGVDTVVKKGFVNPKKMAITGGSYGGFMTAWIIGHDQRFAAAVSQRGVYQLMSFYGTTDIPRLIEAEFGVRAFDDPEKMWKYSPFAYVRNMKTPLLLIHAENDFRVPIADAEQVFTALKRLGRTVAFARYPRDGHELSRSGEPEHRIDRLERMTDWFDKYCK